MCSLPRICRPATQRRSGQSTAACAPSSSTLSRCRWKRKTTVSISGICWTELHKNYVFPTSDGVNKSQQNSTRPCTALCTQLWQGAGCKRPECRIRDSVLPPCRKVHRRPFPHSQQARRRFISPPGLFYTAAKALYPCGKLEVIYVFANIPYLLVVHRPHKLGGHNYR